jgi:hypothetical protein
MCSFALDKPNSNMNQIPIAILFSPCRIPHVITNPGWLIAVIGLIPGIPLAPNDAILTAAALLCPLRGDGTPSLIILGTSTRENLPSILGSLPSIPLVPVLAFPRQSPGSSHQSRRHSPVPPVNPPASSRSGHPATRSACITPPRGFSYAVYSTID